jgi:hypothetical protein
MHALPSVLVVVCIVVEPCSSSSRSDRSSMLWRAPYMSTCKSSLQAFFYLMVIIVRTGTLLQTTRTSCIQRFSNGYSPPTQEISATAPADSETKIHSAATSSSSDSTNCASLQTLSTLSLYSRGSPDELTAFLTESLTCSSSSVQHSAEHCSMSIPTQCCGLCVWLSLKLSARCTDKADSGACSRQQQCSRSSAT